MKDYQAILNFIMSTITKELNCFFEIVKYLVNEYKTDIYYNEEKLILEEGTNKRVTNKKIMICINSNWYSGSVVNGLFSGKGTLTFANGSKYIGQFKDGKINGEGTLTFANGSKYIGQFKRNIRNGVGTFIMTNNDKYIGHWKDDMPNGKGTNCLLYTSPSPRDCT